MHLAPICVPSSLVIEIGQNPTRRLARPLRMILPTRKELPWDSDQTVNVILPGEWFPFFFHSLFTPPVRNHLPGSGWTHTLVMLMGRDGTIMDGTIARACWDQ